MTKIHGSCGQLLQSYKFRSF